MARYRGPRVKILKRLGQLDGLKKHNAQVCSVKEGSKPKMGSYKLRLLEKQKLRYNYGISERQLLRYVKNARKMSGSVGINLMISLEMRLDTIVFRLGWGNSIAEARQLVNHGHIYVNSQNVNIPSFQCKVDDSITLSEKIFHVKKNVFVSIIVPKYLNLHKDKKSGKILGVIEKPDFSINIDELLIVEYYSRR
uniref:ribosomal protein S4 n=1 Tax=Haramonas pauciplastida TaxID=478668 RepID=UPI00211435E8|nr:ribosomal protein S4 [Haramonas pauciplastida]UTE94945.1 ribosomal protein S4 [Haramonas pauciplastida]